MSFTQRARTIAEEAVRSGRPAVASSFRFHRPRGALCGRGYCFSCEVETKGGRALACQTPAASGSSRRLDVLRPLGRVAERWPPWFYERRFLRTELVRRASLEVLRRASAAGRLDDAGAPTSPLAFAELEVETLVVGPSGRHGDAYVVDPERGSVPLGVYPDRTLGALQGDRLLAIRFERLVIDLPGYVRLPPVRGNDLPGMVALDAAERYAAAGALRPGTRVAAWGPEDALARVAALTERHDLDLVYASTQAPQLLGGRGRIRRVGAGDELPCDLFVSGVVQPAVELALQAGARVELTTGELPVLAVAETPEWLSLEGESAARSSGVPDVEPDDDAFACLCEDVRVRDVRACVASGFDDPELVKRRTGAMTGPCQGKLCAAAVLAVLRREGVDARPTTSRPLVHPVALGELAARA